MTDQELVHGIIGNDQAALRCLVDRYQQPVVRTCYSLIHQMEDAEDVAQDVFMEIIRSVAGFKGEAQLSSWIYRIAINKSLNHLKRRNRKERLFGIFPVEYGIRNSREQSIEQVAVANKDPLEDKELKQALHQAMAKLPENQRIAFALHNYEDLAYKEIADIMQLTLASVESLLHRAKKNLQKYLQTYYAAL